MRLVHGCYYHLYNRSNAGEILFKSEENYAYFLRKYRRHLATHVATLAYCLMPTHFHFLVQVTAAEERAAQDAVGVWLSSYTKAVNKRFGRHGSLFQHHTKSKVIDDDRYLIVVLTYIHQNPIRAKLARRIQDWAHSSYHDLSGHARRTWLDRSVVQGCFDGDGAFRAYSEQAASAIDARYWVG